MMIGMYNHLQNARNLGSMLPILRFGEPASLRSNLTSSKNDGKVLWNPKLGLATKNIPQIVVKNGEKTR